MKAAIIVEVPDDWIEQRARESWDDYERDGIAPQSEPWSASSYFRSRLEDVADDELRTALWGWPVKTAVEPHDI